jgi:TRAP-type C4-dicarboxylate transport system substrate-binding protein
LPFVGHDDPVASAVAMWDTYQKFFADKPGQFDKVVLLSVSSLPGSDIWSTTDAPIDSVAELARRKMWAPPGPPANLLKGAGAAVVAGPAVQMLELITNGVVDGFAAIDRGNVDQLKLSGYVKSATHFDRTIALGTFAFFVSKTKWDTISSADQKAIREALGRDYAAWVSMEPRRLYLAALKRQTEAGIRTVDAGPEFTAAMKKIGQADVDRWKAQVAGMGVDADAVVAFYDQAYDQALKDYPVEP